MRLDVTTITEYANADDIAAVLSYQLDYLTYRAASSENVFDHQDVFARDIFIVATSKMKTFVSALAALLYKDSQSLTTPTTLTQGMGNPLREDNTTQYWRDDYVNAISIICL